MLLAHGCNANHNTHSQTNVTRVLVDNGSQTEILFLSTFEQMGFNKK
jgi:hypothetical protein